MISLTVNGRTYTVDVPPEMPLLWAIRETLGLTGTKYGCGMALCGACTVHLNSGPVRACVTPMSAVAGKSVTTIEGPSDKGDHPVQLASTDADIDDAMSGNICRCGTYQRIRAAIHRAAALKKGGA